VDVDELRGSPDEGSIGTNAKRLVEESRGSGLARVAEIESAACTPDAHEWVCPCPIRICAVAMSVVTELQCVAVPVYAKGTCKLGG